MLTGFRGKLLVGLQGGKMKQLRSIISALTLSLLALSAQAGDQLLLKSGTINTSELETVSALMSLDGASNTRHYIVQFRSVVKTQDQEMLKAQGFEILRYVPNDAYIVRASSDAAVESLAGASNVSTVIPYIARFKVNAAALEFSVFNRNKIEKIHVRAFEGLDHDKIESELTAIDGVKVMDRDGGAFIVNAPMAQIQAISLIDGLEWVDKYYDVHMQRLSIQDLTEEPAETGDAEEGQLVDLTGYESGTKIMEFESAWKKGLNGLGQVVAVTDTGLDTGDVKTLNPEFKDLQKGIIGGIYSQTWGDPDGHGTHVAGSIVAKGDASEGKVRGGAHQAKLVMESMWSEALGTITIGPDPTPLFEEAYKEGARIHSNSWGSIRNLGAYDDSARAVDKFMWDNPDSLILFAAGNSGVDKDKDGRVDYGSVSSPGTAKNVLTVGASENLVEKGGLQKKLGELGSLERGYAWPTEPLASDTLSNSANGIAAFSSRGPTADKRLKPDVVAPGTNVLSQCSKYKGAGPQWGRFNPNLCYSGGTSMSTPLVAGGAAVIRQSLVKSGVKKPSAALIKAILIHSADDLYPGQFGEVGEEKGQELLKPGPNNDQGYGRVNVQRAADPTARYITSDIGLKTQQTHTWRLAKGSRRITLVYTDAPGTTAAEKALVNDLDIQVAVADGTIYSSTSKVNNIEQITLPEGQEGIVLTIKGTNIPIAGARGGQPYAVVVTK